MNPTAVTPPQRSTEDSVTMSVNQLQSQVEPPTLGGVCAGERKLPEPVGRIPYSRTTGLRKRSVNTGKPSMRQLPASRPGLRAIRVA